MERYNPFQNWNDNWRRSLIGTLDDEGKVVYLVIKSTSDFKSIIIYR